MDEAVPSGKGGELIKVDNWGANNLLPQEALRILYDSGTATTCVERLGLFINGKGFASEAAKTALDWAEANLEPTPIWAIIAPENDASLRLGERLGFEPVSETLYHGDPTAVLRRPAWG